ncbi:MAG TPA: hypothetical protein VKS60_17450 [Stellaceae bacterium]|nr:hypothetical protein [Stellaceae bacterium]
MQEFVAIILICANSVPADRCDEKTALDVMSTVVDNELGCTSGWQEVIGRSALREEIGKTAYVRTICRRGTSDKN